MDPPSFGDHRRIDGSLRYRLLADPDAGRPRPVPSSPATGEVARYGTS